MRRAAGAACVWCLAVVAASTAAKQSSAKTPELATLLARAGHAAEDWVTRFSAIVAEERYVQDWNSTYRHLGSDILLVRLKESGELFQFRDVFEVDNRALRDRQDRLAQLFLDSPASALEQAAQIDRAGARFNLRLDPRPMVNSPFAAIGFLQPTYQPRFRFKLDGADRSIGADMWIVGYEEHERPTVFGSVTDGPQTRDVVAKGRLWIQSETGRVLKTELRLEYLAGSRDDVVTFFRLDEALQLTVPVTMRTEHYFAKAGLVRGTATYGRFRRFGVRTEERIEAPKPSVAPIPR